MASELGLMGTARFDFEKFMGKNDFQLWRIKMRALLVQQGLQDELLWEKNLTSLSDKKKSDLL